MPEEKKQVNLRLSKELLKKARILAAEQDRTLTDVVRELLEQEVKDKEQEAKLKETK